MPRIARATARGYPHHVTQRGNYQQVVFEADDDFIQYKTWLKEYTQKYDLKIWAYCLMNSHVHLVCVPFQDDSLSRTFNTLHMRYVENNPVRARIVRSPEKYKWSSVRGYMNKDIDSVLDGGCYLTEEIRDWLGFLKKKDKDRLIEDIRKNSLTGRPCGNDTFIQTIEGILGRKLKAMARGRPRKAK